MMTMIKIMFVIVMMMTTMTISCRYGVADRGASIRIPRFTERDNRGYFEDRRWRPAARHARVHNDLASVV